MEIKLSKETVEAVITLITTDPYGTAGLLVGQDLVKLNVPRTENDILEESQEKRADSRKDEDGKSLDD